MTQGYHGNPVTQQRRLRTELRRLREGVGKTQQQVADELEWSLSKVIRIETGVVNITRTDLKVLLDLYEVGDKDRADELQAMARASRQEAWWDEYRQDFDRRFVTFIGFEQSASIIRQFQLLLIPGLLQTEDYARAVITALGTVESRIELNVRVRMERQKLLDAAPGPKMFFIMDEAAIRRQVGGSSVMRAQLLHLKELNQRPNIRIQIIPFGKGAHLGMHGSFAILEFPDDDYVVDVEHIHNSVLIQNSPDEASTYVENFYELERLASPTRELDSMIDRVLAETWGADDTEQ